MIKVLLSGCNGKMGKVLDEIIEARTDMTVVGGVDKRNQTADAYPVYANFVDINIDVDVIIDFSHFSVMDELFDYCTASKTPAVVCTTGLDKRLDDRVVETSKSVAMFKSGNMSLGINLMIDLLKKATQVLGGQFDIEMIEKHHNRKVDAPSGTAYMLADGINEELNNQMEYVNGREGTNAKRQSNEIGIHAVRGGTIVGEHSVIFAGLDEIIEIKHSATSRSVFATGAVNAAAFLAHKESGLYDMNDII